MLSVLEAKYAGEYKIHLVFNNGKTGTADLHDLILNDKRPILSTIRDKESFQGFHLAHDTIVWSDDLDLAPAYLFFLAQKDENEFQELFRQWGYIPVLAHSL